MIIFRQETRDYSPNPDTDIEVRLMPNDASLSEVIEAFKAFLMACGYHPEQVRERLEEE